MFKYDDIYDRIDFLVEDKEDELSKKDISSHKFISLYASMHELLELKHFFFEHEQLNEYMKAEEDNRKLLEENEELKKEIKELKKNKTK